MAIEIRQVGPDSLEQYGQIPMRYRVELENDDRLRLTRLSASTYGLSVKRHTGRWERTPFSGSMDEMVNTIVGCMQHLVAPY